MWLTFPYEYLVVFVVFAIKYILHWIVSALKTEHIDGPISALRVLLMYSGKDSVLGYQECGIWHPPAVSSSGSSFFRIAPNQWLHHCLGQRPSYFCSLWTSRSGANFLHCRDFVGSTLQSDRFPCPLVPLFSFPGYHSLKSFAFLAFLGFFPESLMRQVLYVPTLC